MNDETYVYLCTLLNDRISDLEDNSDDADAKAELEIALIALEELG